LIGVDAGALIVAFVVTVLELTEVVALVFALTAEAATIRRGALGATAGVAVVAFAALGAGAAILAVPRAALLWASAVVLAAFGVFLFRSTLKTYRRTRGLAASPPARSAAALEFAGGFTVGAVEATEVIVVLLALTAAGEGTSAIVGSVGGGVVLVAVAALVHERIRRIKTAWLKLGATAMVSAFAVFWGGEAAGLAWPGGDLVLVPLFAAFLVVVRGTVELLLRRRVLTTTTAPAGGSEGPAGPPPGAA
jgi:Ca2+/H+ antiporter, TMEM165/GDT1 family